MHLARLLISLSVFGLFGISFAQSNQHQYIVYQGDTLSCLAEKFIGHPIYGANGSLQHLRSLNEWIEDQNIIPTGKLIALPQQESLANYTKVEVPTKQCAGTKSRYANDEEVQGLHRKIDRLEAKIDTLQEMIATQSAQTQPVVDTQPTVATVEE